MLSASTRLMKWKRDSRWLRWDRSTHGPRMFSPGSVPNLLIRTRLWMRLIDIRTRTSPNTNLELCSVTTRRSLSEPYLPAIYWRRAWIVQETARARNVVVLCGDRSLHWEAMANASKPLSGPVILDRIRRTVWSRTNSLTLLQALMQAYHVHASDDRDRVYSLMPLASDASTYPRPDYSAPPYAHFR